MYCCVFSMRVLVFNHVVFSIYGWWEYRTVHTGHVVSVVYVGAVI